MSDIPGSSVPVGRRSFGKKDNKKGNELERIGTQENKELVWVSGCGVTDKGIRTERNLWVYWCTKREHEGRP